MKALFLGSIGVLAETSHIQLAAYNSAFIEEGLDWHWSQTDYAALLVRSGGAQRIAEEARKRSAKVNVYKILERKNQIFQKTLLNKIKPRPGVLETIIQAKQAGLSVALTSTTDIKNIISILSATGLDASLFDLILSRADIGRPKPAPEVYNLALDKLKIDAPSACAVEDNPDGFHAASRAGIKCIAFPGDLHNDELFENAIKSTKILSVCFI